MSAEFVQVDSSRATVALGQFRLALTQNEELMGQIGGAMLVSVRRTFRGQGSPDGSWMPLAPSTIKRDARRYGPGHKILIGRGTLLNSITAKAQPGLVIIGTNLVYAAVHQFGSRDRGSIGAGPRTKAQDEATVNVKEHSYTRLSSSLGTGREHITNARGRHQLVKRLIAGPRNASRVGVRAHSRHQNIPARPYLVFRPEDPGRIQSLVNAYVHRAAAAAGLGGE